MTESDVNVMPAPLNHSFGIRRMYGSLAIGSTAVLLNGVTSVRLFFKALDEYRATSIISVPAAMEYVFRMTGDKLGEYSEQLRFIELGADNVPNDLKRRILQLLPKTDLYNIYGSTEAGCVVGINYRENPDKLNSIGKDAVNAKIRFTNDNGEFIDAVSKETSGLLTISGAMVMKGYFSAPELTAETVKGGNLYTSDIGYRDKDGFIFLIGRKGDVINVGGNKVSPVEVEQIANQYPSVVESACVGWPDPNGLSIQVPKLYVVPKRDMEFSEIELKDFIASKLEAYKVPLIYALVQSIPKTSNGKLQRSKLL
jgi:long-chain acyl-CoA synthetase